MISRLLEIIIEFFKLIKEDLMLIMIRNQDIIIADIEKTMRRELIEPQNMYHKKVKKLKNNKIKNKVKMPNNSNMMATEEEEVEVEEDIEEEEEDSLEINQIDKQKLMTKTSKVNRCHNNKLKNQISSLNKNKIIKMTSQK